MFRVTFLGHQGWLVATPTTHLLIDPLLTPAFGHGGGVGSVFPPRRLDPAAFPPIDAVVLTHEHDDHFDIPSLLRLDRRIPILLSSRSSFAAHDLLRQIGFADVRPLRVDDTVAIGNLHYRTFAADHTRGQGGDEYDVCPFVVYDTQAHGSMASSVDVAPTDAMLATLRHLAPRPGIWCHANNVTDAAFADALSKTADATGDAPRIAQAVARRHARVQQAWGPPVLTLVNGAGWHHPGARAWLDRCVFPITAPALAAAVGAAYPDLDVRAPTPGETFVLRQGRLHHHEPEQPWLGTVPADRWPARQYSGAPTPMPDYAPACGRAIPTDTEHARLVPALGALARYLYGRPLFQALCSLPSALDDGREPALGLSLRVGPADGRRVLRYVPTAGAFVDETDAAIVRDPIATYASGIECWATDLYDLLTGALGGSALCNAGRLRYWNHHPERLRVGPHLLWDFCHPLHRPATAARLYATLRRQAAPALAVVPARR